jgi:hypothetical protein
MERWYDRLADQYKLKLISFDFYLDEDEPVTRINENIVGLLSNLFTGQSLPNDVITKVNSGINFHKNSG